MKRKNLNRQYMLENVLSFLKEKESDLSADAQYMQYYTRLTSEMDQLRELQQNLISLRHPLGKLKKMAKKAQELAFGRLLSLLELYASEQGLDALLDQLPRIRKSVLHLSRMSLRMNNCKNLLNTVELYRADLEASANGKDIILKAESCLMTLDGLAFSPRERVQLAKVALRDYEEKVTELYDLVNGPLEKVLHSYLTTDLEGIYERFMELSTVPDIGGEHSSDEDQSDVNEEAV